MTMNSALGNSHSGNVLPKLENTDMTLGGIHTMNDAAGHRTNTPYDKQRGRARGHIAADDKIASGNMSPGGEQSGGEELSSADEGGPSKKRRRSRKGMDRKYACKQAGCGKAYSRAEHLHRHELNHSAKVIFNCDYAGCTRSFVRLDLRNRHRERHDAKDRLGVKLIQNDPATYTPSPSIHATDPRVSLSHDSLSPGAIKTEDIKVAQHQYFSSQHENVSSTFASTAPIPSLGDASSTPTPGWLPPGAVKPEDNRPAQHRHYSSQHEITSSPYAPTAIMPSTFDTSNTPPLGWFPRSNIDPNALPFQRSVYPMREHSGLKTDFRGPERQSSFSNASSTSEGIFIRSPTQPADGRYGLNGMQSLSQASPFMSGSEFSPSPAGLHQNAPRRTTENGFAQQNCNSGQFILPIGQIPQSHGIDSPYPMPPANRSVPAELANYSASNDEFFNRELLDPSNYMSFFYNAGAGEGYDRSPTGFDDRFLRFLDVLGDPPANLSDLDSSTQQPVGTYSEVPARFQNNSYYPSIDSQGFHQMKVNNLLQPTLPVHQISNDKAEDLAKLIYARFNESEESAIAPLRSKLLNGNRDDEKHILSTKKMQMYIDCFFNQFHPQIPILHRPTFTADNTHNLLLIAIMSIGAACLSRKNNYELSKTAALLSNFLAWHLRWEIFNHRDFRPPGKLWMFQTLLLLELYEKMYSDRILHERAHIHHATTITLMRRGTSLIGHPADSGPQSPAPSSNDNSHPRQSPATEETWWHNFIETESTRRAAYAAFIIDSTHATMFGHSTIMDAKEIRIPLPCDENVWAATTRDECYRLNSSIKGNKPEGTSFLSALRDLINNKPVHTDTFGRTVLMAGLLGVYCQMTQREKQLSNLSVGVQASGKWKNVLRKAFDNWSNQYDNFLLNVYQRPYHHHQEELVSESRSVLYHLAHMIMYVDIVECQIYAHASKVLGRVIFNEDRALVAKKWETRLHKTQEMRISVWYALSFLKSVLMPDTRMSQSQAYDNEDSRYKARDDPLLNRPWVLYYAALVVWGYGFAKEGPTKEPIPPRDRPGAQLASMRGYLTKYYKPDSKNDCGYLAETEGMNGNSGLLMIVSSCFEGCRWELLKEAQKLLDKCIDLNASGRRNS